MKARISGNRISGEGGEGVAIVVVGASEAEVFGNVMVDCDYEILLEHFNESGHRRGFVFPEEEGEG